MAKSSDVNMLNEVKRTKCAKKCYTGMCGVIKNDGAHRSSTFFANGGATVRKRFACVVGRMKSAALLAMLHWSVKGWLLLACCGWLVTGSLTTVG